MLSRFLALGVRFLGDIEPQPGFARGFVRSMTLKAAIGKNRSNIAIILKLLCTLRARGAQKQGDAEKQDRTPIKELSLIAFPTRELFVEKLDEFDLIIFDRYQRHGILPMMYLANIADYVKRGGAVLIAAGPDFAAEDGLYNTPLNAVLQVVPSGQVLEGGFKPQVTDRGQRHPVTRGLPGAEGTTPKWGRWFRLVDAQAATIPAKSKMVVIMVLRRMPEMLPTTCHTGQQADARSL